jgi:dihydrofolate reductase
VIGGAEVYAAALPLADELLLTEIELDVPGDTFFPRYDPSVFVTAERTPHTSADGTPFTFVRYLRSSAS